MAAPGAIYRNSRTPVPLVCAQQHLCAPRPDNLLKGQGPCQTCAGRDRAAAAEQFWRRVAALGATAAPGATYVNSGTPVPLICRRGHNCAPRPASLKRQGPCRRCVNRDPAGAEAQFWARVAAHGAKPASDARYVNSDTPVRLVCARRHHCAPRPASLQQGQGPCRACAGRDPEAAESAFWARVADLGASPEPTATYRNNQTPVPLICANGHHCAPRPAHLQQGQGPCRTCAGNDPQAAESAFWARVAGLGARPAAVGRYDGVGTPVPLVCANGHHCAPRPAHLQQGQGPCRTCAGNDPQAAESAFWARVTELGASPAPGVGYRSSSCPVPLVCANGHPCAPRPSSLQRGQGPCGQCVVVFDRLYLMAHPAAGAVKVGIASRGARLRELCNLGYRVVAVWGGLTHDTAVATERSALSRWRENGIGPVEIAPRDGRSETAPIQHLFATRAWLVVRLGSPGQTAVDLAETA